MQTIPQRSVKLLSAPLCQVKALINVLKINGTSWFYSVRSGCMYCVTWFDHPHCCTSNTAHLSNDRFSRQLWRCSEMLCQKQSQLIQSLQAVLAEVLAQVVAYKMGDATL